MYPDNLNGSAALLQQLLGAGKDVVVLTSFAAEYNCKTNDPQGLGRPARSLVTPTGAIHIKDGSGNSATLPDMGAWQWVGIEIDAVGTAGSGTTATTVVVIW